MRLGDAIDDYLSYLRVERGRAPLTLESYTRELAAYRSFLEARGIEAADAVQRADVAAYEADLVERGFAPSTVKHRLSAVKGLHRFLVREGMGGASPADDLPAPKAPRRLPDVLSIGQIDALLGQPFPATAAGERDRAILEVLYGCGLRASECCGLDRDDCLLDEGCLRIRGKDDVSKIIEGLEKDGFGVSDMSDNELAKLHIRHLVGGNAPQIVNERVFRFEFPERPGALLNFVDAMHVQFSITLFQYRYHGADFGRVLVGFDVPQSQNDAFQEYLDRVEAMGYPYVEETDNDAYRLFLGYHGKNK